MSALTIRLPVDDAIHNVRARVAAGVPRVLEARERAPVERRVRVRDVRHQCLRNGEVCLRSKMCQRQPTRAPHTYIICVTRSSVLEVDVVRLEVDVAEEGLEGRACWPGADERGVEGGRDEEDGGLRVVHACLDELVVPDVHEVAGRGVAGGVEGCFRV